MTSLFWLCFLLVLYTYAGYPILIAALARLRPRPWLRAPWPRTGTPGTAEPPISILMAVHNGAAMLPAQIDHLLSLDPARVLEVLVVSDGSTDATPALLESLHGTPRLIPILQPVQAGKTSALNHAVARARGEILLFVDIRPHIEPGALESVLANFADPSVGCVAGELLLETEGHDRTASAVSGLYWKYEQAIRIAEATVDSPVGVYGGFYAIRRALATPAPDGLILDDMFQPLAIIRQGYRSVLDRAAFVTDRWPSSSAGEFTRKVRTLAGNFQLIQQAPWTLTCRVAPQLISHKLMRLVVPWCFLLMLPLAAALALHSAFFAVLTLAQLAFWTLAAVSLRVEVPVLAKIGTPASALLVLNAAAVVGLGKFLFTRGPLWRIWSPTVVAESTARPTPIRPA